MVWATNKTSAGLGNWNAVGTWNPAEVPHVGDYVEIQHAVTIDCDAVCDGLWINGGTLHGDAGHSLAITDAAATHAQGCHILIDDAAFSGFQSLGTKASPFLIKSASATPTYPVKMLIMNKADPDVREMEFDYCELRNLAPSLGNHTNYLFFNTGDVTTDGILNTPKPIDRAQKIDDVYCEGRSYSRIYPEGGYAGTLDLSGLVPWSGYTWHTLATMRDARTRVSYIGQFCSMPKAIIESLKFGSRDGPYVPFSLTLVEDR